VLQCLLQCVAVRVAAWVAVCFRERDSAKSSVSVSCMLQSVLQCMLQCALWRMLQCVAVHVAVCVAAFCSVL